MDRTFESLCRFLACLAWPLMMAAGIERARTADSLMTTIPVWSEALAKATDPGEPPFIATYREGEKVLGFVASFHVFDDNNPTTETIRRAFDDVKPTVVVVEGFPTAFGRSPALIIQEIQQRGTPNAKPYARGEPFFTAALALSRNVSFIGGEPTPQEEIDGLVAQDYRREDILVGFLVRNLGQAQRAGMLPVGDAVAFSTNYAEISRGVGSMTRTEPIPEPNFKSAYLRIVGVDPVVDRELITRMDPGTDTLLHRLAADDMRVRDAHILSTLLQQLAENDRVLVVYGGSHWTTMAAALRQKFGAPVIQMGTAKPNDTQLPNAVHRKQ